MNSWGGREGASHPPADNGGGMRGADMGRERDIGIFWAHMQWQIVH